MSSFRFNLGMPLFILLLNFPSDVANLSYIKPLKCDLLKISLISFYSKIYSEFSVHPAYATAFCWTLVLPLVRSWLNLNYSSVVLPWGLSHCVLTEECSAKNWNCKFLVLCTRLTMLLSNFSRVTDSKEYTLFFVRSSKVTLWKACGMWDIRE